MRVFKSPPLVLPRLRKVYADDTTTVALVVTPWYKRNVAGAANINVDFLTIMAKPLTEFVFTANANQRIIVNGRSAVDITTGYTEPVPVQGDIFELEPGGYNVVQHLLGDIATAYTVSR